MEGTGMLSDVPVKQDGKKLWQYLSAAAGNLLKVFSKFTNFLKCLLPKNVTRFLENVKCELYFRNCFF